MQNDNENLKEWLKNKKTLALLIFLIITNIGDFISATETIYEKIKNFYTWLGESNQFSGNWSNDPEGYIDGTPDFLMKNKRDDLISLDLNVENSIVSGEVYSDYRMKRCGNIDKKYELTCKLVASNPLMVEGKKLFFMNSFDAYVYEYRGGEKVTIAILNMKINDDNSMLIKNTMRTPESITFPSETYMIKLSNESN